MPGSFFLAGKLPFGWKASFSFESCIQVLKWKHPSRWETLFSLISLLFIGSILPNWKISSHQEVPLTFGSVYWEASTLRCFLRIGKLITTENFSIHGNSHFKLKAPLPYSLLGKYIHFLVFALRSSGFQVFGLTTKN